MEVDPTEHWSKQLRTNINFDELETNNKVKAVTKEIRDLSINV